MVIVGSGQTAALVGQKLPQGDRGRGLLRKLLAREELALVARAAAAQLAVEPWGEADL